MKTKLLSLLMLLAVATTFAQITTSPAGIAVQGIARDINNTARVSKAITLTFDFYYGSNTPFYTISKQLTTDAFGVFSTVLEPGAANNILIANNDTFLKISEGTTIISDERLRQVPYAIAASNGVPTGAIMPFMGTTAPAGWALCDGAPLPSTATALIALVGSNAPSLGGRFLKGAGTAVESGVEAITLKTTQSQSTKTKEHLHGVGTLKNIGVGNHAHNVQFHNNNYDGNGGTSKDGLEDDSDGVQADLKGIQSSDSGAHNHDIIGSTANSAIDTSEVRPSSYGVNYIIKL